MYKFLYKFAIRGLNVLRPTALSRYVRKLWLCPREGVSNSSQQLMAPMNHPLSLARGEKKKRITAPTPSTPLHAKTMPEVRLPFKSRYKELHSKRRTRSQDVKDPLSNRYHRPVMVFCFVNARWSKIRVPSSRGRRARAKDEIWAPRRSNYRDIFLEYSRCRRIRWSVPLMFYIRIFYINILLTFRGLSRRLRVFQSTICNNSTNLIVYLCVVWQTIDSHYSNGNTRP